MGKDRSSSSMDFGFRIGAVVARVGTTLDADGLLWHHGLRSCCKLTGMLHSGGKVLWSSCTAHAQRGTSSGGNSGGLEVGTAGYSMTTSKTARLTPSRSSIVLRVEGHWSVR